MAQALTTKTSPAVLALGRLIGAHAALTRQLNAELLAEHELSINDYEVLLLLSQAEERSMRRIDLAQQVRLSPSGVTRMLDRLETAGLVEKGACESDARVSYAVLTDAGLAKLKQCAPGHRAAVERVLGNSLDAEQLETLIELLERLPGAAEADCTEPA